MLSRYEITSINNILSTVENISDDIQRPSLFISNEQRLANKMTSAG